MSSEPSGQWPIVVGGVRRSGTSLLRRILNAHRHIHCSAEVKFFHDLNAEVSDRWRELRFLETVRSLADEDELVDVLGGALVELHQRAARRAGKPRWADKAPENVRYWPQWQRLLGEGWWLVHVARNPLDTIASIVEANFLETGRDMTKAIAHYCELMEAAAGFAAAHPGRYRLVVYEQLVQDPETALSELMRSVGEELEPAQLRFNDQPQDAGLEDFKIDYYDRVHTASLHRWRALLSPADSELAWDLTAELWRAIDPELRYVDPPAEPGVSSGAATSA